MYWPLAKASGERSSLTRKQGERLHQDDPRQRLHDALPRRSRTASRAAGWPARRRCARAYSITIERLSGSWRVSASRNQNQSPRASSDGDLQGVRLAGPAGGEVVDREDADPGVTAGELAGDRGGPVGAPVVDDEDFQVRVGLARRPRPGSRPGVASSSLAGMIGRDQRGHRAPAIPGRRGREDVEPCRMTRAGPGGGSARWRRSRRRPRGSCAGSCVIGSGSLGSGMGIGLVESFELIGPGKREEAERQGGDPERGDGLELRGGPTQP